MRYESTWGKSARRNSGESMAFDREALYVRGGAKERRGECGRASVGEEGAVRLEDFREGLQPRTVQSCQYAQPSPRTGKRGPPPGRTWNASLYACSKFLILVRSATSASSSCNNSSNIVSLYRLATSLFWIDSREKLTRRSAPKQACQRG